jgi:predicted transcriptional regulator
MVDDEKEVTVVAPGINDGVRPMTPEEIELGILEAIKELQGDHESSIVEDTRIAEKTGIDLKVVDDYIELLVETGHLIDGSDSSGHAAALTPRGRIMLSARRQRASQTVIEDEIGRRILQAIRDNQADSGITVQDSVIAEKIGLSVEDIQDHLDLLEEQEMVELAKTTAGYGAWLTGRGRLALKSKPVKGLVASITTTSPEAIRRLILASINEGQGQNVRDSEIVQKTGLDLLFVRDHLDLLAIEDMLVLATDLGGSRSARLKPRGRLALAEETKMPSQFKNQTILLLAANPKDTKPLRLDEECRRIEESMERSRRRDEFNVVSKWAVTDDELRHALLRHEPAIVHFSGHGTKSGIEVEGELGYSLPVSASALAGLFKLCSSHVQCVVLNACFSQFQATAIAKHIDFVVGMGAAIGDQAAIKFSQGFYDGIGHGRSFVDAFELGRNAIDLRGIPEHEIPILLKRGDKRLPSPGAPESVEGKTLEGLYEAAAIQARQSRSGGTWTPEDIEDIRSQVWANVDNLGESTARCPIDGFPMKIKLHTFEFRDADISAYCVRHGQRSIEKGTDPMRPNFEGKEWAEHHIKGMAEISLQGYMVNCPVCGTVVRSSQDSAWVLLNCLRCGKHAEVPVG